MLKILNQPKPFYIIFLIEMFERFGFYGMQALLVAYMIHERGFSDKDAFSLLAAFSALASGLMYVGGILGDRFFGIKRTLLLGAIVLALGYFLIGLPDPKWLYRGLGFIIVGNTLFKANPSNLLSRCYRPGDHRIDGAFTLYYMAINLGSFVSTALAPIVASHYGWSVAFWMSAIGLLLTIANFIICYDWVKDIDTAAGLKPIQWLSPKTLLSLAGVALAILVTASTAAVLLDHLEITHRLLNTIFMIALAGFGYLICKHQGQERTNLGVALILMLQAVVFWTLYMQIFTSMNLFAIHNVQPILFGFQVNPISFQALNPATILIASPFLAMLYSWMAKQGKDFLMPTKFTIGMFLCAAAFLAGGFSQYFAVQGMVPASWLVAMYVFGGIGELYISGLGLAMISRLVPDNYKGFMMGAWFLTLAAASLLSGFVAGFTSIPENIGNEPMATLPIYTHFFMHIGLATLVFAVLMMILAPWLNRALTRSSVA